MAEYKDFTSEIAEMKQKIYHLEQGSKDNICAHSKIYKRLEDVEKENCKTTVQYEAIMLSLNEMKTDIKLLKEKPAKRIELVITTLITLLVSGVGGFILSRILG